MNYKPLVLVAAILLIAAAATSKTRRTQKLPSGNWGGPHIRISIDQGSATVEYDCANGTIKGPLNVSSNGTFSWRGFHRREGPGPIREDVDQESGRPALYSGTVKGDTMKLTVKLSDKNEVVNSFTLTRGGAGRVFKCK